MRGIKSPKFFFVGFIITCAGAGWYGAWRNSLQSALPADFQAIKGLVVKQRDLDLGTVWEDDHFHYQLPIKNWTDSDIRVIDLVPS